MKISSYYLKYRSIHALNQQCHTAMVRMKAGSNVE